MRQLCAALVLLLPSAAYAAPVYVPGDYSTIGAAITAASAGDTIIVSDGDYAENLTVAKSLTIEAASSTPSVNITGPDTGSSTIYVNTSGTVVLRGLNITGGARGVNANSGVDLTLDEVTIDDTTSTAFGPGLRVTDGDVTIIDSLFDNNEQTTGGRAGGHIYMDNLATNSLTISGSTFINGTADLGAAIAAFDGDITITDSHFEGNVASSGGVFYVNDVLSLTSIRSVYCGNTATDLSATTYGGVLYALSSTDIYFVNSIFADNDSDNQGGAAYFYNTDIGFENNTFVGNTANDIGSAIGMDREKNSVTFTTIIRNNNFVQNTGDYAIEADENVGSGSGSYGLTLDYNLWYGNTNDARDTGGIGSNAVEASAMPIQYAGKCAVAAALAAETADTYWPLYDNEGIDAGYSPDSTYDDLGPYGTDTYSTATNDIGAFGGSFSDPAPWVDGDSDDWPVMWDCDDGTDTTNPGADEVCDDGSVDEDCDGDIDDDDPSVTGTTAWYEDGDSDGYGDKSGTAIDACVQPSGYVDDNSDCDDGVTAVNPSATEICDDIDNDCDGTIDEADAADASTWYYDGDSDGYGDPDVSEKACDAPTDYVSDNTDCDDGASGVNPGAAEVCDASDTDEDCDGLVDDADPDASGKNTYYVDDDDDGFGTGGALPYCDPPSGLVDNADDCDDTNAGVNPDATEVCDDLNTDEDCDGKADDADSSVTGETTWYDDSDGDGYGDESDTGTDACEQPADMVDDNTDCDDGNKDINPGAQEVCDDADTDEDCDGVADDDDSSATGGDLWYADDDDDGYGDPTTYAVACDSPPTGSWVLDENTDCDDTDGTINPGAADDECTDGIDNDCDGAGEAADDFDEDGLTWAIEDAVGASDCTDDSDSDSIGDFEEYASSGVDTDGDGLADIIDDDDDNDGVGTLYEELYSTAHDDPDTDGDGVDDGDEWGGDGTGEPQDSDLDGTYDPLDSDDDNDGVPTQIEGTDDIDGQPPSDEPCDSWGSTETCSVPDGQDDFGDGIPNYLDLDSDGDGIPDAVEGEVDSDEDGIPDYLDCNDCDGCDGDADGDTISNCDEDAIGTNKLKKDSDGDGVPDFEEVGIISSPRDTDDDGLIDAVDTDDDDDGIPTIMEDLDGDGYPGNDDTDGDGLPNYRDDDDDDDGIPTWDEDVNGDGNWENDDDDGDGNPDYLDAIDDGPDGDLDGDGWTNAEEDAIGSDPESTDSDGDGVPDDEEMGDPLNPTDTDGDGKPDILDDDDDGDGILTVDEGALDIDGDGTPNYLDDDSDGDGVSDADEGTGDVDCDQAPDFLDDDPLDGPCAEGGDTDTGDGKTDPETCGCAVAPNPLTGGWLLAIGALLAVRRRR